MSEAPARRRTRISLGGRGHVGSTIMEGRASGWVCSLDSRINHDGAMDWTDAGNPATDIVKFDALAVRHFQDLNHTTVRAVWHKLASQLLAPYRAPTRTPT